MPIDVGTTAPDFTLKNQDEKDWKLSDHKGKNVVLLWYPLDWSPTCEKENCKIDAGPMKFPEGTVVVGISRDSTWCHKAWKESKGMKHDLLADPLLQVTAQFGLVHPAKFISHRATVVVDKTGKVAFADVQEKTGEERVWGPILDAVKKLG